MPKRNRNAPAFTLPADDGTTVSLAGLKGRTVVLFFYQKDGSPGCTQEACEFSERLPRFTQSGAVVLGISPDSPRKHANFSAKYALPFRLLSDADRAVCERYGVWKEKLFWGRKYMGVERSTFIIDATGKLVREMRKVSHAGHAEDVAKAVRELAARRR